MFCYSYKCYYACYEQTAFGSSITDFCCIIIQFVLVIKELNIINSSLSNAMFINMTQNTFILIQIIIYWYKQKIDIKRIYKICM